MENPRISMFKSSLELRDAVKCGICLGPLSQPVTLHCHHSFCSLCIQHAISIKAVCPLCSVSVLKRNIASSSVRNGRIVHAVDEFVNAITSRSRYTTDEWQLLHPVPPPQFRGVPTHHGNALLSASTGSSTETAKEHIQSPPVEFANDEMVALAAPVHEEPAEIRAIEAQLVGVGEIVAGRAFPEEEKEQMMSLSQDRNEAVKQDERIKPNVSTDDEDMSAGDLMELDQHQVDNNAGGGSSTSSSSSGDNDNDSHPATSDPGEPMMIQEEPEQPVLTGTFTAPHASAAAAAANANANANAASASASAVNASVAAAAAAASTIAAAASAASAGVDQNVVDGAHREEGEQKDGGEKDGGEKEGEQKEGGEKEGEEKVGEEEKREEKDREEKEVESEKMGVEEEEKEEEKEEEEEEEQLFSPPPLPFHQGDEVDVLPRCWIGSSVRPFTPVHPLIFHSF